MQLNGANSSDVDGDQLQFSWSIISKPESSSVSLSHSLIVNPKFTPDAAGSYVIELIVNDGELNSVPSIVTITTTNSAPVAEAGTDQTLFVTDIVQLDGSGSNDVDGDLLVFNWSLVSIPGSSTTALSDPLIVDPTFTIDFPGIYVAGLIVNDGEFNSEADVVTITTQNSPPVANAGADQTVFTMDTVQLLGNGSTDVDGDLLVFKWAIISKPDGSTASISNQSIVNPILVPDLFGVYIVQLIVNDSTIDGEPDTVIITTENSAPIADAGLDQSAFVNDTVLLDGTNSSDVDGNQLTFKWSLSSVPQGSAAVISELTISDPSFTVDLPGTYVVQLIVNDGTVDSEPDTVVITTKNSRPIANAGIDQTVVFGSTVMLDGNGSIDVDNDSLSYSWSFTSIPFGSAAIFSDSTSPNPTFTADIPGFYIAQLIVNDGLLNSEPDTVTIITENRIPIANTGGDQVLTVGDVAKLDGSGSIDPDGSPLTYQWSLVSVPTGSNATLTNTTISNPSFSTDLAGIYIARLVVNDGDLDSNPDDATITAILVVNSKPPVANAGTDQTVTVGSAVQLDGTASFDPDGEAVSYNWEFVSLPNGSSTASLSNPNVATPRFVADMSGNYLVKLVVNDGLFNSIHDIVNITAAVPDLNDPPILTPIGNHTVALGSSLTIDLAAFDPDNDNLTFSAAPLPLPTNAILNAVTGKFTFKPDATQIGDFTFTFGVSDNQFRSLETVVITVMPPLPGAPTSFTGRLLDTNDFASSGIETPVVGATISFLGSGTSTVSDATGNFSLANIPSGDHVLDINSTTSNHAPDGSTYAGFRKEQHLIDSVNNIVDRPFYMPRIESQNLVTVNPSVTTIVENSSLNITLEVPPNTAKNEDGTNFTGQLSINEVPKGISPGQMPDDMQPGLLITIQPVGVTFSTPVPITFPNTDYLPPGSELDIWSLESETGTFVVVGTGVVSADGKVVATVSGGVRAADWHFVLPTIIPIVERALQGAGDDPPCGLCPCEGTTINSSSATYVKTGNYSTRHNLVTYRSLGVSKGLSFIYNSQTADPRPVIKVKATIVPNTIVPLTVSSKLKVAGIEQGTEFHTRVDNVGDSVIQAVQFNASAYETGFYGYEFQLNNNYFFSKMASTVGGTVLVNNKKSSPFGAGWELKGIQKIILNNGGSLALSEGNGSIKLFKPWVVNNDFFNSPSGDYTLLVRNGDGTFTRTLLKNGTEINFNNQGLQTSVVDRNNNITAYGYDANRLLTSITDPVGLVTTLSYSNELLSTVTDPAGRITTFEHDSTGNLIRIVDPDSSAKEYIYDERNRIVAKVSKRGFVSTIGYNFAGQNIFTTRPDGSTRQVIPSDLVALHDPSEKQRGTQDNPNPPVMEGGNFASFIDGNGNVITHRTNVYGGSTETIDQLGRVTTMTRDENNNVTTKIQPNGLSINMAYDERGNLIVLTHGGEEPSTVQFEYTPVYNQLTKFIDAKGNITQNKFDTNGNMTQSINVLGNVYNFVYDEHGQVSSIVYPIGSLTTFFNHNTIGNTISSMDPLGNESINEYDTAGNVIKQVDAEGRILEFNYDTMNRLISVTDAAGGITNYSYGFDGNLITITNPRGEQTLFEYDEMNQLTTKTNPLGLTESFAYDDNGNLIAKTTRNGEIIEFSYNAGNQLTKKRLPNNEVNFYDYDESGNVVSIANTFSKITRVYDSRNRIISVSTIGSPNQPDTIIQYSYDLNGNRIIMTDPSGGVTNYEVDALNRITSITNPLNQTTNFTYDGLGRQTSRLFPNGDITTYDYEGFSLLSQLLNNTANGLMISSYSYTYDKIGNRVTQTENVGNRLFNYDLLDRLVSTNSTVPNLLEETLGYDLVGNRLTQNGTITVLGENAKISKKLIYNAENQLESFQVLSLDGTTNKSTYKYDGLGRRIEKNVAGIVTRYVYDFEDILLEYNGNNTLTTIYTHGYGIDDPLIMQKDIDGDNFSESIFYHTDGLGSITELTDASGAIIQHYKYDSFGNIVEQAGNIENSYKYTGREFDKESGLYFYRARYYNQSVGRFLSVDPIAGFYANPQSQNSFIYVQNNPINFVDPFGLKKEVNFTLIGAGIVLLDVGTGLAKAFPASLAAGPVGAAVVGGMTLVLVTSGLYVTGAGLGIIPINPFDFFDPDDNDSPVKPFDQITPNDSDKTKPFDKVDPKNSGNSPVSPPDC